MEFLVNEQGRVWAGLVEQPCIYGLDGGWPFATWMTTTTGHIFSCRLYLMDDTLRPVAELKPKLVQLWSNVKTSLLDSLQWALTQTMLCCMCVLALTIFVFYSEAVKGLWKRYWFWHRSWSPQKHWLLAIDTYSIQGLNYGANAAWTATSIWYLVTWSCCTPFPLQMRLVCTLFWTIMRTGVVWHDSSYTDWIPATIISDDI